MQKRNHSRVKLNETPRQFVIKSSNPKRSCSTNKSNPSSLNTSLSSSKLGFHEDKHHPEDGKLLDLIIEHENHQQSQIFNLQLSSFSIIEDQVEKRYAISDDPNNPQLRRNLTYNWYYHQDIQQNLISEHLIFGQSLRKQGIKEGLRAKMVDWMIEVYGNYSNTTTHQTFFRSVGIMDLFLKKTSQYFQDQELHLIGIVCMFIASKLEDIYHIPLMDFVNRVGHSKFTISQIKLMEQNILETLIYQVCFPTPLDYLQNVYYKCFSLNDSPQLLNIYETCIYIQKMCIHDYAMMGQPPSVLAAAIFGYAIKEYIESKQEGQKQLNQRIIKQSAEAIIKLVKIDFQSYYNCEKGVSDLINSFKQKYPELLNLEKFS